MEKYTMFMDWKNQLTLIHGPNIPGSYAVLFFIASDFTSITSHIHSWMLFLLWLCLFTLSLHDALPIYSWVFFLLWLHPFILSGVISPLISSSILGTYSPGEFLFQYPIILSFHTVLGVLKARILKWFAIPSSS